MCLSCGVRGGFPIILNMSAACVVSPRNCSTDVMAATDLLAGGCDHTIHQCWVTECGESILCTFALHTGLKLDDGFTGRFEEVETHLAMHREMHNTHRVSHTPELL
mmetsp:Transcript_89725/g.149915  ORF Transcript_89725/g.149915 Transcript_89725/m.149915 type:complete len:106 (+) Transcript_89725:1654-1971(+)